MAARNPGHFKRETHHGHRAANNGGGHGGHSDRNRELRGKNGLPHQTQNSVENIAYQNANIK